MELDDWIRSQHRTMGGRVFVADIKDAGWNSDTDYYTDNQHLNYLGAYKAGKIIGPVLREIMGNASPWYNDPGDFGSILPASAAGLPGTGGSIWSVSSESVSGQVANGCVVGLGSGGTRGVNVEGVSVVCSKEIDQKGYNVQRVDVTAEAGAPSFELYFLVAAGSGSYTNATRYYSYMKCRIEDADNVERFDGGTWTYTGTTSYNANQAYASYAYTPVSNAGLGIGHIDEADVALSAGLANTGGNMTRLWAAARIVFMAGGGSGTFRISRPTTRPFTPAETS